MNTKLKKLNNIRSSRPNYAYSAAIGNNLDYNSISNLYFQRTVKDEYIISIYTQNKKIKEFEFISYIQAKKHLKFILKQFTQFSNSLDYNYLLI